MYIIILALSFSDLPLHGLYLFLDIPSLPILELHLQLAEPLQFVLLRGDLRDGMNHLLVFFFLALSPCIRHARRLLLDLIELLLVLSLLRLFDHFEVWIRTDDELFALGLRLFWLLLQLPVVVSLLQNDLLVFLSGIKSLLPLLDLHLLGNLDLLEDFDILHHLLGFHMLQDGFVIIEIGGSPTIL